MSVPVLPPFQEPMDERGGLVTRIWQQFFMQLKNQAGTGSVTAVTGTTPIVSSGGTAPNITHANSGVTAATYGDATHVPQIAVDAKGHITSASNIAITSGAIQTATVTLTNAQIKALPTPFTVVAAQGASTRIVPVLVDLHGDFSAGAYTGLDVDAFLSVGVNVNGTSGQRAVMNFIANDDTVPVSDLDDFLSAHAVEAVLVPFTKAEPVNNWGNLAVGITYSAALVNAPVQIWINNGLSLGGGNAANTLTVTTYYAVVAA